MKLDYLPKLLLQHDESPYDFENIDVKSLLIQAAEEHNLVYCVHPLGLDIALACGQRLVLLHPTEQHQLHFATPTAAPETITALAWISLTSSEDSCILVGTSEGYLQLHSPDGALLFRQELHDTPVVAIHARFSGSSLDPDDSSEDVTVTFATAVVRLASLDISAAVKWHQRNRAGGGAWWDAPRQLTPAKWELKGTGTRSFAAFAGPAPTPLYTLLARRKEPHRLLLFTAGANPPLGCFYVEEGAAGGGLLSLVGNLASSSASFLGRARGVVGMGVEANPNNHSGPSTPDAGSAARAKEKGKKREKIPATAAGQETAVWDDDKRSLATVSISPCSRWAACCDTLGRVLLVDVGACMVLRIFKGYRDAQAAWIVSPPLSDTTYSNQISSPEALLVLFAPKRGAVELWRAHAGVKLGSVPVATQRGLLLQQPALPVVPSGAEQRGPGWKEHRPNACWLLDLEALELVELTSQLGELAGKGGR